MINGNFDVDSAFRTLSGPEIDPGSERFPDRQEAYRRFVIFGQSIF